MFRDYFLLNSLLNFFPGNSGLEKAGNTKLHWVGCILAQKKRQKQFNFHTNNKNHYLLSASHWKFLLDSLNFSFHQNKYSKDSSLRLWPDPKQFSQGRLGTNWFRLLWSLKNHFWREALELPSVFWVLLNLSSFQAWGFPWEHWVLRWKVTFKWLSREVRCSLDAFQAE